ncbi:MAG: helix-turn-helix transcriptional regulator [Acidimicrobiia bacterium]
MAAGDSQPAPQGGAVHADGLSADEFSAAISAVTSAFGDPTRRDIYLFVRSSDPGVTASAVAEHFDLHPNVARHHLEKLAGGGYVTVELARHESAGRPSKRYRAAAVDTTLSFPPRRDELLATLLARALELLDPGQAEAMADEVGFEYGRAFAARMAPVGAGDPALTAHKSVRAALSVVADALTAHGFAAHTERRGRLSVIVAEQCPFGDAAQRYPHVVCAVDRGMIRGMLAGLYGETDPRFTETRPLGDDHCVARV